MDFLKIMMLTLCISRAASTPRRRRHHGSSSEEDTIENMLYFKDCQTSETPRTTSPAPVKLRMADPPRPPPQPPCPFPKMCCALSCGNECGSAKEPSFMSRQMEPIPEHQFQPFPPMMQSRENIMPVQPSIRKRKKMKFPQLNIQTPINARRALGFTKEKIKSLINQDDDIRKILKDLVRVTMQKVDLQELQTAKASSLDGIENSNTKTPEAMYETEYDEDYVE